MYVIWFNITTGEKNEIHIKKREDNNKRESRKVDGATN